VVGFDENGLVGVELRIEFWNNGNQPIHLSSDELIGGTYIVKALKF